MNKNFGIAYDRHNSIFYKIHEDGFKEILGKDLHCMTEMKKLENLEIDKYGISMQFEDSIFFETDILNKK